MTPDYADAIETSAHIESFCSRHGSAGAEREFLASRADAKLVARAL